MSYSFVRLYLPKCVVCVLNYMFDQTKKILIILSVFGSDFYHSLCSCFVLTLFFIILKFKHVLYWKTGVRVFRDLFATRSWFASREIGKMIFFLHFLQLTYDSRKSSRLTHDSRKSSRLISRLTSHEICRSRVHPAAFATPLWLTRDLRKFSRLASHEMPRNSFLKGFSWETYFKHLPSSLKPLFQYFYIKTQSIWMFFHSI